MERALLGKLPVRGNAFLNILLVGLLSSGFLIAWQHPGVAGLALLFPIMVLCFFHGPKASTILVPTLLFHYHLVPGKTENLVALLAGATGIVFSTITAYKYRQARLQELKLEEDLSLAKQVQNSLLPKSRSLLGPLEIATHSLASRQLGGDFLCFSRPSSSRYGLLMGDIMGKGTQAALTAAMLDGIYSELTQTGAKPALIVQQLNRYLTERFGEGSRMATLFCLEVDIEAQAWRYCRAGHPPPLLVHADSTWVTCDGEGLMAGVLADTPYSDQEIDLSDGDQMFLVTDGLLESDFPHCAEIARHLIQSRTQPIESVQTQLIQKLRSLLPQEVEDDETAALLRYCRAP